MIRIYRNFEKNEKESDRVMPHPVGIQCIMNIIIDLDRNGGPKVLEHTFQVGIWNNFSLGRSIGASPRARMEGGPNHDLHQAECSRQT